MIKFDLNSICDIHPHWKLTGIVDTDNEKLNNATNWGIPEDCAFPTITDAVKWSDEPIDAVLIATPILTHHALTLEAMEHGLHVICEKNMAMTREHAEMMVKAAQSHPELCTAMGTQYRFRPSWWTLKTLLQAEDSPIGSLATIRAQSMAKQGDMRFGWRAWLPEIYPSDMMVHHMDALRYATGLEIIKIQAQTFTPSYSKWLGSSTVFATMVLAPRGEVNNREKWVYTHYSGDWQARGLLHSWEDTFSFFGPKGSLRIETPPDASDGWAKTSVMPLAGEPEGAQIVFYEDGQNLQGCNRQVLEKRDDIEHNSQKYVDQMYMLEDFYQCVESKGKRQPQTNFQEGYRSFLATWGAVESSKTGYVISLPEFWI